MQLVMSYGQIHGLRAQIFMWSGFNSLLLVIVTIEFASHMALAYCDQISLSTPELNFANDSCNFYILCISPGAKLPSVGLTNKMLWVKTNL